MRIGVIGGCRGRGIVRAIQASSVELDVELTDPPPPAFDVTLLLALPRPKCLRRILHFVASMGVKRLALYGTYRVEKSYWETPWLEPMAVREQLVLGLEQAGDTALPVVTIHPLFKPFIEDTVPILTEGMRRLAAHPRDGTPCPANVAGPVALAIGPEGGYTDYELNRLRDVGFALVTLGPRPLRTEHAVAAFLGRLAPLA